MDLLPAGLETPAEASLHVAWRSNARSLKGALIHIQQVHPAIAHGVSRVCAHMATPTHESYAAAKRILAWLSNRADLGVTYGASNLTCAADLLPPKDDLLPMGDVRDCSLFCTVDSDLPGKGLPVRDASDTTYIDKQKGISGVFSRKWWGFFPYAFLSIFVHFNAFSTFSLHFLRLHFSHAAYQCILMHFNAFM